MTELHGPDYFNYYANERKWDPRVKGAWQANYAAMIDRIFEVSENNLRVLDVGGACGCQASAMRDRGIDVWVIEPEPYFCEISPFKNLRGRMLCAPAQDIPFRDGWFDLLHCSQVLEHIPTDEIVGALGELRRVTKLDGRIVATLPMADGRQGDPDGDVTHQTIATDEQWSEWLYEAGWWPTDEIDAATQYEPMWRQYDWDYFVATKAHS